MDEYEHSHNFSFCLNNLWVDEGILYITGYGDYGGYFEFPVECSGSISSFIADLCGRVLEYDAEEYVESWMRAKYAEDAKGVPSAMALADDVRTIIGDLSLIRDILMSLYRNHELDEFEESN